MFYCTECGLEFYNAKKIYERHSLDSPPYEKILCCPNCCSHSITELKATHCRCCGIKLSSSQKDYCSDSCKKRGELLWKKQTENYTLLCESPLNKMVREVEEYNIKNHTNLSYGQYVAFIKYKRKKRK